MSLSPTDLIARIERQIARLEVKKSKLASQQRIVQLQLDTQHTALALQKNRIADRRKLEKMESSAHADKSPVKK